MAIDWESSTELEKTLILLVSVLIPMTLLPLGAHIYFLYYGPSGQIFTSENSTRIVSNLTETETEQNKTTTPITTIPTKTPEETTQVKPPEPPKKPPVVPQQMPQKTLRKTPQEKLPKKPQKTPTEDKQTPQQPSISRSFSYQSAHAVNPTSKIAETKKTGNTKVQSKGSRKLRSYPSDSNSSHTSHAINPTGNLFKTNEDVSLGRFYRNKLIPNSTIKIEPSSNHFNVSIRNKRNSSCDCFKIDQCYNLFEPHKFISSISDPVYEDDPNDYKYKCASVLLTDSYILSSINCLTSDSLMRVSSEYWSKDGYVRQISSIKKLNNSIVIGQLSKPLINDKFSIKFIQFSNLTDLKNIKQVDTYRWNSKYTQSLNDRRKYTKLYKIQLNITDCEDKSFIGFCTLEKGTNSDLEQRDMVFKMETNKLLGIEVKRVIQGDQTERYYVFIKEDEIKKHIIDKSYLLGTYIFNMHAM